ncbi:MAG: methyl-accepting chemotaxis protein, partial [Lawsonibacter sp.]|nr:methyl-accepting chemotaxis protein [Lawsonibacter sp.]
MAGKQTHSHSRETRRSLNGRILKNTTLNILILVVICCVIMAISMQFLANNILLDSLQPMARQSAKTVEANIHMLADRMMTVAGDPRMAPTGDADPRSSRQAVLAEAAEIYELHTIALYSLDGRLVQGISGAPEQLDGSFLSLLQETDNLTTDSSTRFQGSLGVTMGMPVKAGGETVLYLVGVYKYDTLNDVISSINLGKNGTAYMVNKKGIVTGHPDQSMVLGQSTLSHLSDGAEQADSRIITGETGATEYTVEGERMLVAFSPIRGTQWALIIQVPKSDYYSLISNAIWVDLLFTLALLAVSILLVLRLARSISRPVKEVTNRMVALSDGDLHTDTIAVRSGDELEVLTKTLDSTLYSMNHYISDIRQVLTQIAEGNLCVEPQGRRRPGVPLPAGRRR